MCYVEGWLPGRQLLSAELERSPALRLRPEPVGPVSEGAGRWRRCWRRRGRSAGRRRPRLHPTQAGDGDSQRQPASQGRPHPPEQEDGPLVRPSSLGDHRRHQTRLGSSQEDLHHHRTAGTLANLHCTVYFIRPQQQQLHAAYCYRRSNVVCLCVCLLATFVGLAAEPVVMPMLGLRTMY